MLALATLGVVALAILALREDEPAPAPFVTPARAPAATETAPPPASQPSPPPRQPVADEPAAAPAPGGPELIDDQALMALLNDFGFQRLEGAWREWAASRGYPVADGGGVQIYDQPYEQYDDDTLRGLSDNGDMWAAQILAGRIAKSSPADAIELYRRAAAGGSLYAMHEMATLYNRVADQRREVEFKSGDAALEQVYAMRDAPVAPEVAGYAWTIVAEMAGSEPMFGALASSQLEQRLQPDQLDEACEIARGLFDDLRSERRAQGLGDFDRTPPPLVYADPDEQQRCPHAGPGLDLSGCRELVVQQPEAGPDAGRSTTVWICGEDQ